MSQLRNIVKSVVPYQIRQSLWTRHRDFVFWQAMKIYLKDPAACAHSGNPVIKDLIYGWGNESWSAMDEFLVSSLEQALTSNGPTLECGSGLSTILVGAIAKQRGYRHWVLEHKPEWAVKVHLQLDRYGIDSVVLCTKPLRDYGEFFWYDPPLDTLPEDFPLVLCDGPPGDTVGGRYGLVPVMRKRLTPGCIILLDDADREQEQVIARRWETELGVPFEMFGRTKPYIKMTVADSPAR